MLKKKKVQIEPLPSSDSEQCQAMMINKCIKAKMVRNGGPQSFPNHFSKRSWQPQNLSLRRYFFLTILKYMTHRHQAHPYHSGITTTIHSQNCLSSQTKTLYPLHNNFIPTPFILEVKFNARYGLHSQLFLCKCILKNFF